MGAGEWFWIFMVIWFCFGLFTNRGELVKGNYYPIGGNVFLFILFGLLGWRTFGPVLQ